MTPEFVSPTGLTRDLDAIRLEFALPGLAWAVAPLTGALLAGASGVRRQGHPQPLTVHDRLHLGSCTKPMTATLIATLVPEVLQWTTRISDVLPPQEVHPAYHEVTPVHLLGHLSGLPPFEDDSDFRAAPRRLGTPGQQRDAFVRWVLRQEPVRPLGEYGYSNAGFGVAAVLAERLTGRPWEALMQERVFGPLGLTSAGYGWPARDSGEQPWGHWWRGGRLAPHNPKGRYHLHPGIAPAGDVGMNIIDFAGFAHLHLRGLKDHSDLLPTDTFRLLHTPARPGSKAGLGWGISTYRDRRASSHSGSADTFLALLLILPDEDHAFVVVANAAGDAAEAGTKQALGRLVAQFTEAHVRTS